MCTPSIYIVAGTCDTGVQGCSIALIRQLTPDSQAGRAPMFRGVSFDLHSHQRENTKAR